jgi:hypothetical protein
LVETTSRLSVVFSKSAQYKRSTMSFTSTLLAELQANEAAIDAAAKALASTDLAGVGAAQAALDAAITTQDAFIATLVADVPAPPAPPTPPAVVPAFEYAGFDVGALGFNFDASVLPNGPLNFPGFAPWFGGTGSMNSVKVPASSTAIKDGLLVLTLVNAVNNGVGAAVTSNPWMGTGNPANPFSFKDGLRETKLIVPAGGWWAIWDTGQTWPQNGEFDTAENAGFVAITSNYHYGTGAGTSWGSKLWPTQPKAGDVVTISSLTFAGRCTSFLNGVEMVTNTTGVVDTSPHCLILNIGWNTGAVSGDALKVYSDRVWLPAA